MTKPLDDARGELLATIAKIDHLLEREEHDSGYAAFVYMRRIWPQLKQFAAPVPQCKAEPVTRHITGYGPERYAPLYAAPVAECEAEPDDDANLPTAEDVRGIIPRCDAESVKAVREKAANAIRTFCQSLGAGVVVVSSDGVERIYYAGLSLDALSVAVALALVPPPSEAGREWRCFHCDEVFTDESKAQEHFGFSSLLAPGCIDPLRGDEKGMLARATDYERLWRKAIQERDDAIRALSPDPGTVAVASAVTEDGNCDLAKLWNAIVDHTRGNGFWLGEALLDLIHRETGFHISPDLATSTITSTLREAP